MAEVNGRTITNILEEMIPNADFRVSFGSESTPILYVDYVSRTSQTTMIGEVLRSIHPAPKNFVIKRRESFK